MVPIDMTAQLAPITNGMLVLLAVAGAAIAFDAYGRRAAQRLRQIRRFLRLETAGGAVRA